jgi:glycosyltransferase involved in cell wall biosynthesis
VHLAILTQYYPPEIGAPQARLSELAAHFTDRGHAVTVLTALPNYPSGKIQPGYGRFFCRERRASVDVVRTFIYPTQKADLVRRLSNYFSFVMSSALVGPLAIRRPDYLMVESPPLFLGLTGLWLSRVLRARLIFNVSDLWPESAVRLGVLRENSAAHRLSSRLEAMCYRRAWLVTGQSRSTVESISARFPDRDVFHLSNGVDTRRFGPDRATSESRAVLGTRDKFVILYAGLHGLAQGLDQVLDVAERLRRDPSIQFVLVGEGPEKARLIREARQLELAAVRFLAARRADDIPALLAAADVVLIALKTYIPGAVPSKLYEAMATGKPIVLIASGEAAEIVNAHRAGLTVRPGDVNGLAAAIRRLRHDPSLRREMGENGRRAAEQHFDRTAIATRFAEHLEAHLQPAASMVIGENGVRSDLDAVRGSEGVP